MTKKTQYMKQFKRGNVPDQHWDESVRVNGPETSSPDNVKNRQGLALGTQEQARPGLVGKNDYKRK